MKGHNLMERKLFAVLMAFAVCGSAFSDALSKTDQYVNVLDAVSDFENSLWLLCDGFSIMAVNDGVLQMNRLHKRVKTMRESYDKSFVPIFDFLEDKSVKCAKNMPKARARALEILVKAQETPKSYGVTVSDAARKLYMQYVSSQMAFHRGCQLYMDQLFDLKIECAKQFVAPDTFCKPTENSMFGIKLGQVIDFEDKDVRAKYGIYGISNGPDLTYGGSRKCSAFHFIPQKKFQGFNCYLIHVDKKEKTVFDIKAEISPFGGNKRGDIYKIREETWHALAAKYQGKETQYENTIMPWKECKDEIKMADKVSVTLLAGTGPNLPSALEKFPDFKQWISISLNDAKRPKSGIDDAL